MRTPDWANDETVVFSRDPHHGLLIQRGDLLAAEIDEARAVASIETLGDARRLSASQPWVASWLEDLEPDLDLVFGTADPAGDTPVGARLRESYLEGSLPVPWDPSRREWLPDRVRSLTDVGGASPAGHLDAITFTDPDQAINALREAGYELVEDGDALRTTLAFPDLGD